MNSTILLNIGFLIWQQFFITILEYGLKLFCNAKWPQKFLSEELQSISFSHCRSVVIWWWGGLFHVPWLPLKEPEETASARSTVPQKRQYLLMWMKGAKNLLKSSRYCLCPHFTCQRKSSFPTERLCRYSQSNLTSCPTLLLTGIPLITLPEETMPDFTQPLHGPQSSGSTAVSSFLSQVSQASRILWNESTL